jgi:hypothetical protein
MALGATSRVILALLMAAQLCGCIETEKLNALRPDGGAKFAERDDRPRVNHLKDEAKESFIAFVANECRRSTLENLVAENPKLAPGQTASGGSGGAGPPAPTIASLCVNRISAYAVDQCAWITRSQNKAALTTSLLMSFATIGAATASNIAILAHPSTASKSGASLLAASILGTSDKIKVLSTATVPWEDMLKIGPAYADAISLQNSDIPADFTPDAASLDAWASDPGIKRLARVHDAVLGICTGNAIGI